MMASKSKITYTFRDGTLNTDIVEVKYAHIDKPDEEYDRYSVTFRLDPEAESTKTLFDLTLDFENSVRKENGLDAVDIPSNWTRKGKPSKDEDGYWLVSASMKPLNKDNQPRKPRLSNVYGDENADVRIWGGDKVVVFFTFGSWYGRDDAGSKYFLSAIQQIKPGNGGGGAPGVQFKDMSGALVQKPEPTAVVTKAEIEDEDDNIPF